jgi:hypothetical protein
LKRIVVANGMIPLATITSERYDASGGEVVINADGRALDICSGGSETMRFTWQFTQDVTRVSEGSYVSASLQAGLIGKNEPCGGALAAFSFITIAGSKGITFPLPDEDVKVMEVDRFVTISAGDAWAGRDPKTATGSVGVDIFPATPDRPFAYFFIRIAIRGMGQELRYVYIYERGEGGGGPVGGGGGAMTVEPDSDRPGSDYRDFDLPQPGYQACLDACANEPTCVAYTYVKPGMQGPNARCWLKSSVPNPIRSACCVSGIKQLEASERWVTYSNPRFGTTVDYPADLFAVAEQPSENGDGQVFHTADGRAELMVYGTNNIDHERPEVYVPRHVNLADVSYKKMGSDFYVVSGTRGATIFYERCNFPNDDVLNCFSISYPATEKAAWDAIVTRISRSLRFARN